MELNLGGHVYALEDFRNYFIDPRTATLYRWRVNHDFAQGDDGVARKRSVSATANSGNVGLVRQQSGDEPITIKRKGTFLDRAQEEMFWQMLALTRNQTIYYVEFNGDAYEVQLTNLEVKRKGILGGARKSERFVGEYVVEMEVLTIWTGVLAEAGVAP